MLIGSISGCFIATVPFDAPGQWRGNSQSLPAGGSGAIICPPGLNDAERFFVNCAGYLVYG